MALEIMQLRSLHEPEQQGKSHKAHKLAKLQSITTRLA